jgi:GNAT superfamily N-acetyltransferase
MENALPADMLIRPARDGEHVALTELVWRSVQQTWNYPPEFMEWEPETISVEPEHIRDEITNLLEEHGRIVGFYVLSGEPPEMELSRMMIEPDRIGAGIGRILWDHAVATAAARGVRTITIDSDPNAEPFYQRMGAITTGEHDWAPPMMPDWRVKKMHFNVPG